MVSRLELFEIGISTLCNRNYLLLFLGIAIEYHLMLQRETFAIPSRPLVFSEISEDTLSEIFGKTPSKSSVKSVMKSINKSLLVKLINSWL